MEVRVLAEKPVFDYLDDLVGILVDNHYFPTIEEAKDYVNEIYDFFVNSIHRCHCSQPGLIKCVKGHLQEEYGRQCRALTYRPNKNTTWCAVYSTENNVYLIHTIFNNHVREYNDIE